MTVSPPKAFRPPSNSLPDDLGRAENYRDRARHGFVEPRRQNLLAAQVPIPTTLNHRLNGKNFDVFIRLRCDVIVDHKGNPVDGNLLARFNDDVLATAVDAPTGDGIPGGQLESWISSAHERQEKHVNATKEIV